MNSTIEIKKHTWRKMSLLNKKGTVDISSANLDFLFDRLNQNCSTIYFEGLELNRTDIDIEKDLDYVTEDSIQFGYNQRILLKVKQSSLTINRALISEIWKSYEYPSLIFLKNENEEERLIDMFEKHYTLIEFTNKLNGIYVIYTIWPAELWIECSYDIEDLEELMLKQM